MHKKHRPLGVKPSEKLRVKKNVWSKKIIYLFFLGVFFFSTSLLAYRFQYAIPHLSFDSGTITRPDASFKNNSTFRQDLTHYGVAFQSLTYATQSATLIVKLPHDAYAYLNTNADSASQAKLLATILSRISIENKGKVLKYIDLTHEKAVVQF